MSRARKVQIVQRNEPVSEYESAVAQAMHRLADVGELIADGLFACAAGAHTKTPGEQRDMAAVFTLDARDRYGDVLRKLTETQRQQLECFVQDLCKRR